METPPTSASCRPCASAVASHISPRWLHFQSKPEYRGWKPLTTLLPKTETSFMKIVFSFLALLAASALCLSNVFAQAHLPEGAKTRIGKGGVYELAYTPDGTQLAAASAIGIWIYDARTGEALRLLTGHTDYVRCVAFSPDGTVLVSGSYDGTVLLWDLTQLTFNQ